MDNNKCLKSPTRFQLIFTKYSTYSFSVLWWLVIFDVWSLKNPQVVRFPKSCLCTPLSLDGSCHFSNPIYKWMRTGVPILGNHHVFFQTFLSRNPTNDGFRLVWRPHDPKDLARRKPQIVFTMAVFSIYPATKWWFSIVILFTY